MPFVNCEWSYWDHSKDPKDGPIFTRLICETQGTAWARKLFESGYHSVCISFLISRLGLCAKGWSRTYKSYLLLYIKFIAESVAMILLIWGLGNGIVEVRGAYMMKLDRIWAHTNPHSFVSCWECPVPDSKMSKGFFHSSTVVGFSGRQCQVAGLASQAWTENSDSA